MGLGFYFKFD